MADHLRILQWIESIVDSSSSCTEPCQKRVEHTHKRSATTDFIYPYNIQAPLVVEEATHGGYLEPHTPPATGTDMDSQSTPRRQLKRQNVDVDDDDANDPPTTPTDPDSDYDFDLDLDSDPDDGTTQAYQLIWNSFCGLPAREAYPTRFLQDQQAYERPYKKISKHDGLL
ncbi:hypothetical protein F4824DRAFT_498970 [Ustulina deusta]|nr:hypothetical protein F4824DRAFT_498970 [Ustulina deusta]